MTNITSSRKLSNLTDLVLLLVGIAILLTFWSDYRIRREGPHGPSALQVGSVPTFLHADWRNAESTAVLILNKDCKYCTASSEFYRRLVKPRSSAVQFAAAFRHDTIAGRDYLDKMGVWNKDMQLLSIPTASVATPTLILCDRRGVIKRAWVGKLSAADEAEAIREIDGR